MIELLTNIVPVILGWLGKLTAIKTQFAADNQKMMIQAMIAKADVIQDARKHELKESPYSAFTRRVFIFTVLGLIVFMVTAPVFLSVPTVVPTVQEGLSFLGFEITPSKVEYITVKGMLLMEEVRVVFIMIAEMYFGAQLAKAR